jgi:hypothetical protein
VLADLALSLQEEIREQMADATRQLTAAVLHEVVLG